MHCACTSHVAGGCHTAAAAGSASTRTTMPVGSTARKADIRNRRIGALPPPRRAGTLSFRGRGGGAWRPAPAANDSDAQPLAGLDDRLEPTDDVRPAAGDALRRLRRVLELVVDDRQLRHALAGLLELPADTAVRLRRRLEVVERAPGVAEQPRRVGLQHLAVDELLRAVSRPSAPWRARLGGRLDGAAVEVLLGELRLRDRVPHLLRRRADEDGVHLGCLCSHGAHAVSSNSVLRSASAETRRSVYLSIHRSWISRIGTGLRKCSFSRPCRRATTRPASSSTRRCFITPKRVMSSSDSSSVSVRPSRSKSRSSRWRRVPSANALKTRSSSTPRMICDQIVTCQAGRNEASPERV